MGLEFHYLHILNFWSSISHLQEKQTYFQLEPHHWNIFYKLSSHSPTSDMLVCCACTLKLGIQCTCTPRGSQRQAPCPLGRHEVLFKKIMEGRDGRVSWKLETILYILFFLVYLHNQIVNTFSAKASKVAFSFYTFQNFAVQYFKTSCSFILKFLSQFSRFSKSESFSLELST